MLEFITSSVGVLGSMLFISKNPKVQMYGSIAYMISNTTAIAFFYSVQHWYLMGQQVIFLVISILMFVNRIRKG